MRQKRPAKVMLIDGTVFEGSAFGADGENTGEVCFNTAMTGYQEILTDPSYAGQIMTMTYPLIGNVGVNVEDEESERPWVAGFIVREASRIRSNFRSEKSLDDYLAENNITAIEDVDTRRLVRHVRNQGAMMGIISSVDLDDASLLAKVKSAAGYVDIDWIREATCDKPFDWDEKSPSDFYTGPTGGNGKSHRVAAVDYGMKRNILRCLTSVGCRVRVFPATVTAQEIIDFKPDGVFLSNGPGNPETAGYAVECIKELLGKYPIFGICMGHELLGLALGGGIAKLKFGHRGANHPVMNLATREVEITSQNHGFVVADDLFRKRNVEVTHLNLNDETNEGLRCTDIPAFSVQYHPEASPGPHDASYLFGQFVEMMR